MAGDDAPYLAWLRASPCAQCGRMPAGNAHHHTHRRAFSRRASDRDAIPLCHDDHMDFHNARGAYQDWTRHQRRSWQDAQVDLHLALYARKEGVF